MMKFFHISIVWSGAEKPVDQLRPILDLADDWIAYGMVNFIIYTEESAYVWQGRMRAITGNGDSFFVCEIANIGQSGGWLAASLWDWIKRDRSTPYYRRGLAPQILPPLLK